MKTVPKGIRITRQEEQLVQRLLPCFPECTSEADMLRQGAVVGLHILAAQVEGLGGYKPAELVAMLKYRVLPAITFLVEHNALPALFCQQVPVAQPHALTVDDTAADDLADLGTDFLD